MVECLLKEAENGDIVCAGELEDKNGEWNNASHTWLLRLDSLGCFEPGCGTLDTIQLVYTSSDITLEVQEEMFGEGTHSEAFIIYPNPGMGIFNIHHPNQIDPFDVQVYDFFGRIIYRREYKYPDKQIQLDMKNNDDGIYLLSISSKNYKYTKKIVKISK